MRILKVVAISGTLAALAMGMSALPAQAAAGSVSPGVQRVVQQSPDDCLAYLNENGYASTPARVSACNSLVEAFCIEILEDSQVLAPHAVNACRLS
ncbi:hypothetical protein FE391_41030 [Nonomuraea sp. KC401]|uniref:hypothetical protein n=1 Tax=unclassified Nonomuraea TaxID=2593643 RepID=UPI0010FDD13B|nr:MULTISPECIES: hypothetical protein [unclassified Nonomuraea]NBE98076.1 hypothetical protein [Nonomuraea sp. K271]TLF55079.1 hypothetical protein FE391_41030 [Nonomuraea sp. KC401]